MLCILRISSATFVNYIALLEFARRHLWISFFLSSTLTLWYALIMAPIHLPVALFIIPYLNHVKKSSVVLEEMLIILCCVGKL